MKSPTITVCPNFSASVISVNIVWPAPLIRGWGVLFLYYICISRLWVFHLQIFPTAFLHCAYHVILHKQCSSPGDTVLIFLGFGALAILYSPTTRSPWTLCSLFLSLFHLPASTCWTLDLPESFFISVTAPTCTFSSASDFISKCGVFTLSNASNEKWKYQVETGCVESLYKQCGEQCLAAFWPS